jgi:hypothetical protein
MMNECKAPIVPDLRESYARIRDQNSKLGGIAPLNEVDKSLPIDQLRHNILVFAVIYYRTLLQGVIYHIDVVVFIKVWQIIDLIKLFGLIDGTSYIHFSLLIAPLVDK